MVGDAGYQLLLADPGAATTEMVSNLPGAAISCCATVHRKSTTVAPPGLSTVPNFAMPLMRHPLRRALDEHGRRVADGQLAEPWRCWRR